MKLKKLITITISICLALNFISTLNLYAQSESDPIKLLPKEINGWKAEQEDKTFNEETLYDYIDGGAELFISFGFSKVVNRIYSQKDQPDIIVDIFCMNSSRDAYGVFSHSVGEIGEEYGRQSQVTEGTVLFWGGNYYVSIFAYPQTNESKTTVEKIAKIIDDSISDKGSYPSLLNFIPGEGLISESIRYFRHYVWLNSHGFISNENILNISQSTECVLAQYSKDENKAVLLLIEYPSNAEAEIALDKFANNFNANLRTNSIQKNKDGSWMGITQSENFVIGVFNSSDNKFVRVLFESVKSKNNR